MIIETREKYNIEEIDLPKNIRLVTDVNEAITILSQEKRIACDIETSGLSPFKDKIAVISLYGNTTNTAAILHIKGEMPAQLSSFLSEERNYIYHNGIAFDCLFLYQNNVNIFNQKIYDTLIGEQVTIMRNRANISKSLKATLKRRTKKEIDKKEQKSSWMVDTLTQEQIKYCVEDVLNLHDIRNKQITTCANDERINALQLEIAIFPSVLQMELNGLPVDLEELRKYRIEEGLKAQGARDYLKGLCGDFRYYPKSMSKKKRLMKDDINLASPQEVLAILHHLGFPVPDTKKDTLNTLATINEDVDEHAYKIFKSVVEGRQGQKRSTMYDDEWLEKYVSDNCVKARFNQCSTDTTRFSSSDPNLQQIPKGMRKVFVAPDGYKIVNADYSQLEAWIAAGLAGDKQYIEDLQSGDVHSAVASKVFRIPIEEFKNLPKDEFNRLRKVGKFCNFLLLFGGGIQRLRGYALANGSNMTDKEATDVFFEFMKAYQDISMTRHYAANIAKRQYSYTITLPSGAKRNIVPETGTTNLSPTQILNTKVQGTAACGLKFSLLELQKRGMHKYLGAVVHDEIVAVVPDNETEEYGKELIECMEIGMKQAINLPIKAELKIGQCWT